MESISPVAYFTRENYPARVFECPRHRVIMMEVSCVAAFQEAKRTGQTGRRAACLGCPIGPVHSGELAPKPNRVMVCVRCRRSPSDCDDPRHVGAVRLVRGGLVCVSCYNREREVVRKRNAKGTMPVKWAGLRPITVVGLADDGTKTVMTIPLARDLTEAILTLHRKTGIRAAYAVAHAPNHVTTPLPDCHPIDTPIHWKASGCGHRTEVGQAQRGQAEMATRTTLG